METWTTDLFVDLVARYHADMARLAYGMLADADAAQDVVQSAWTAAWLHRGQLRDSGKVRAWLLTITANHARKALRWSKARRMIGIDSGPEPRADAPDADARLDLVDGLKRLDVRDRQMLVLRYGLGLTSAEVGSITGLSASGVRVRLTRLLPAMKEMLDDV